MSDGPYDWDNPIVEKVPTGRLRWSELSEYGPVVWQRQYRVRLYDGSEGNVWFDEPCPWDPISTARSE